MKLRIESLYLCALLAVSRVRRIVPTHENLPIKRTRRKFRDYLSIPCFATVTMHSSSVVPSCCCRVRSLLFHDRVDCYSKASGAFARPLLRRPDARGRVSHLSTPVSRNSTKRGIQRLGE